MTGKRYGTVVDERAEKEGILFIKLKTKTQNSTGQKCLLQMQKWICF